MGDDQLSDLAARRTLFYTAPVVNTPRQIKGGLTSQRQRLRRLVEEALRREEAARFAALNAEAKRRQREFLVGGDWLSEAMPQHWAPPYADLAHEYTAQRTALGNRYSFSSWTKRTA